MIIHVISYMYVHMHVCIHVIVRVLDQEFCVAVFKYMKCLTTYIRTHFYTHVTFHEIARLNG